MTKLWHTPLFLYSVFFQRGSWHICMGSPGRSGGFIDEHSSCHESKERC